MESGELLWLCCEWSWQAQTEDPELLADRAFLLDAVVTNPDVLVAGLHAWPGNRWRGFG